MIDSRRSALERHLEDLRKNDGWRPFQNYVIGLLHHEGYTDIRYSNARSDFGRDAVAVTPDGRRCVVAVSFECTKSKVLHDAKRAMEDPDREDATILLFVTSDAPTQKKWSPWKKEVAELGLELRMFHRDTILAVATRDGVWRETCSRLGLSGDRPGFRLISPYDGELVRAALQARPAEWLAKRIELREWKELSGELRNRLILGKPGAGKTTTLFVHLEETRPGKVLVVEPDLRAEKVDELLDAASGGGVIVFDDAHEKPNELRALMSALRSRPRDPGVSVRFQNVRLLIAARSQEWAAIDPPFSSTELQDLDLTTHSQVVLGALSLDQCRKLVNACVEQWSLTAEGRLLEHAAARAALCDATPFYVLSMLAPARVDGKVLREYLAHLPATVLELWRLYWRRLKPVDQGVLRLVKLFRVTWAPARMDLFDAAARAFSLSPHEVSASLDALETSLWISWSGGRPTCLDVQLEAIALEMSDLIRWDLFIRELHADPVTKAQMHIGTGTYVDMVTVRAPTAAERRQALVLIQNIFSAASKLAEKSALGLYFMALANLSLTYLRLAVLDPTNEGHDEWIRRGADTIADFVRILEYLDTKADMAAIHAEAGRRYLQLANLQKTRESRGAWLSKAHDAVEEALGIYRGLDAQVQLVITLELASRVLVGKAENFEDGGIESLLYLRASCDAIEEAVRVCRGWDTSPHQLVDLLKWAVVTNRKLYNVSRSLDSYVLRDHCIEGKDLAQSIDDENGVAYFENVLNQLG